MDFGSLVFLSSRIMHHLYIQLNTNTGYREQLMEHLSTAHSGRNRKRREAEGVTGGKEKGEKGMVQDKAMSRCNRVYMYVLGGFT